MKQRTQKLALSAFILVGGALGAQAHETGIPHAHPHGVVSTETLLTLGLAAAGVVALLLITLRRRATHSQHRDQT